MLNGLFDIDNRLEYLTENGDILPNLKKLVPREDFRGELEVIYDHGLRNIAYNMDRFCTLMLQNA